MLYQMQMRRWHYALTIKGHSFTMTEGIHCKQDKAKCLHLLANKNTCSFHCNMQFQILRGKIRLNARVTVLMQFLHMHVIFNPFVPMEISSWHAESYQ